MDTDTSKPCELDTLVIVNFGQDCDLIDDDCDFDELLNDYLRTSTPFSLRMLLANLKELEEQTDGYTILIARYRGEFAPERWDMTAEQWLKSVEKRVVEHLHDAGHSSELSQF